MAQVLQQDEACLRSNDMAYKAQDFKCNDCGVVFEELLNTSDEEPAPTCCPECNSTNTEKTLGVGTGSKTHGSWSRWRV